MDSTAKPRSPLTLSRRGAVFGVPATGLTVLAATSARCDSAPTGDDFAFHQVDVFSPEPFRGNPLAVVVGADRLSDAQMALFSKWTNLSETTFLLRPTATGADYRIQSLYGGSEAAVAPEPGDLAAAQAVMAMLPFDQPPLYARIDMVRLGSGQLALIEAELIEPYLYPEQDPGFGARMADALLGRLR